MTEPDVEYHTRQIMHHVRQLRDPDHVESVSPSEFRLPTGEELREMRQRCGYSQDDLADVLEYSQGHVYAVETGNAVPSFTYLRKCLTLFTREWPEANA